MTSSARIYALLIAVVVFFLSWATVAAHPWRTAAVDPRVAALAQRRAALQQEALRVQHVLAQRWTTYRVALARRQAVNAATAQLASAALPAVSAPPIVAAPPATSTHTS